MAQNETWLKHDLLDAVKVQYLDGNLFSMDNAGNLIGVTLTRDGVDYSGGGSVSANVIRSDGGTVAVSGALSGKTATVVLPQSAYAVPGVVSIVVKLTASGQVTTIAALVANVYRSSTDTPVDPGTIIPSVQALIAAIDSAVASIPADYSSLWASLAPAFSTSSAYTAGKYVTYNGGLYRFTTDHAAGAWNSSQVASVNLGGEISDLKSALNNTDGALINMVGDVFGIIPYVATTVLYKDFPVSVTSGDKIIFKIYDLSSGTGSNYKIYGVNGKTTTQLGSASYNTEQAYTFTDNYEKLRLRIGGSGFSETTTAKGYIKIISRDTIEKRITDTVEKLYATSNALTAQDFPNNLFNPSACVFNAYVSSNGNIIIGTNPGSLSYLDFVATDFISVVPGKTYIINKGIWTGSAYTVGAYYNSSKQRVSGITMSPCITVPSDVSFIRFSIYVPDCGSIQEVYFAEETQYVLWDKETVINGLCKFITYSNNLIDPPHCINNFAITKGTGSLRYLDSGTYTRENFITTNYIPVVAGKVYRVNKGITVSSGTTVYCLYDSNKEFISDSGGNWSSTKQITIPAGASFIRFVIYKGDCDNPFDLYFAEINMFTLLKSEINTKEFIPGNLIKPFECIDNVWINGAGVLVTDNFYDDIPATTFFTTGFIEVTPGQKYVVNKGTTISTYNVRYSYFDSSKSYISGGQMLQRIVVPDNNSIKYIRFSVNKNVCKTPFDLYFANALDYELENDQLIWCNGKKINWIGDSIVAGTDFDEVVSEKLNLYETDYGIGGSSISIPADSSKIDAMNPIISRYTDMRDDADIIAVSAGTNDFGFSYQSAFGDMTSTDNTTFYGALKNLCEGLLTKYPGKVIFFTTPIKRADSNIHFGGLYPTQESQNSLGKILKDYRDAIIEVCAYYGIPVLDMWGESMMNPTITAGEAYYNSDKLHPNAAGRSLMARRVCGWLKQLAIDMDS